MRNSGVIATVTIVMIACSDEKRPTPALLGVKSEAVLAGLKSGCTGRIWEDGVEAKGVGTDWLECSLPSDARYRVTFDHGGRITEISIDAPEKDAVAIFEGAIAPIVPNGLRETMRQSVTNPDRMKPEKPGPCIDVVALGAGWKESGATRHISWHLDDCVERHH